MYSQSKDDDDDDDNNHRHSNTNSISSTDSDTEQGAQRSETSNFTGLGNTTFTGFSPSTSYVTLPLFSSQSGSSTAPSHSPQRHQRVIDPRVARLSKITEKSDERESRLFSRTSSASNDHTRPSSASGIPTDSPRLAGTSAPRSRTPAAPGHSRFATDPGSPAADRPIRGRLNELISVFESQSPTASGGHSRASSTPAGGSTTNTFTNTGTRTGTPSYTTNTYTPTFTPTYTQTFTNTRSNTPTYSNTRSNTPTYSSTRTPTNLSATPPPAVLRRPQISPRSPLASVRNIVALWKERTPSSSARKKDSSSPSPPQNMSSNPGGGRQRAVSNPAVTPMPTASRPAQEEEQDDNASVKSGELPPGFDLAELGSYAQSRDPPSYIGNLWYLNVHASPPYRWQRCQALLYPHMLLLSWLAPGGGRGVVALDLLNCTSVQSAPSPIHPSAQDDIGTISARQQSEEERDGVPLMDVLVPFHMMYADGVERLAAESFLERHKWVNRIWETVNRPIVVPDSISVTRSPTGSVRTIHSIHSESSHASSSASGSRSTFFVPPLSTIPDISDFQSNASALSRQSSFVSTRTVDDTVIQNQEYVYRYPLPGDPRVITPTRGGSLLRRSGSMTDIDEEFREAVRRARGVIGGSPVTISSGSSLGKQIFVTPPPSVRAKSSDGQRSSGEEDRFFSAGSSGTRSNVSSTYFSQGSFSETLTQTQQTMTAFTSVTPQTVSSRTEIGQSASTSPFSSSSYRLGSRRPTSLTATPLTSSQTAVSPTPSPLSASSYRLGTFGSSADSDVELDEGEVESLTQTRQTMTGFTSVTPQTVSSRTEIGQSASTSPFSSSSYRLGSRRPTSLTATPLTASQTAVSPTPSPLSSSYRLGTLGSDADSDVELDDGEVDMDLSLSLTSSPSRLSRAREIRRRRAASAQRSRRASSGYQTDASGSQTRSISTSDKENDSTAGSRTPTGSYSSRSASGSGSYSYLGSRTAGSLSLSGSGGSRSVNGDSRSGSGSGSYTPRSGSSGTGSYTPSGSGSGSGSYTPGSGSGGFTPLRMPDESNALDSYTTTTTSSVAHTPAYLSSSETGYDICPSSDFTSLTRPTPTPTTSDITETPITRDSEMETLSAVGSDKYITAMESQESLGIEYIAGMESQESLGTEYVTAPLMALSERASITSYESLPTLRGSAEGASETDYRTASEGPAIDTDYKTASEPSVYITAEEMEDIPSIRSSPVLSVLEFGDEPDADQRTLFIVPSVVPSIRTPSPSIFSESELAPEEIPLPPSRPPSDVVSPPPPPPPILPVTPSPRESSTPSPGEIIAALPSSRPPVSPPAQRIAALPSSRPPVSPPPQISVTLPSSRPPVSPPAQRSAALPSSRPPVSPPAQRSAALPSSRPPVSPPAQRSAALPSSRSPVSPPAQRSAALPSSRPPVSPPPPPPRFSPVLSVTPSPWQSSTPSLGERSPATPSSYPMPPIERTPSLGEGSAATPPPSFPMLPIEHEVQEPVPEPEPEDEDEDWLDERSVALSLLPSLPSSTFGDPSMLTPSSLVLSSPSSPSSSFPSTDRSMTPRAATPRTLPLPPAEAPVQVYQPPPAGPRFRPPPVHAPPPEQRWSTSTDLSYESSILAASPSIYSTTRDERSVALSLLPSLPSSTFGDPSMLTPSSLVLSSPSSPSSPSSSFPSTDRSMTPRAATPRAAIHLPPTAAPTAAPVPVYQPTTVPVYQPPAGPRLRPPPIHAAPPQQRWSTSTDHSYESSILAASPSVHSIALFDPLEVSFETSIFRPTGSPSSVDRMSTIPPTLSPIESMGDIAAVQIQRELDLTLTPVPGLPPSIEDTPDIPTPSSLVLSPGVLVSSGGSLGRTPSTYSTISTISDSSSWGSSVTDEEPIPFDFPEPGHPPEPEPKGVDLSTEPSSLPPSSPSSIPTPTPPSPIPPPRVSLPSSPIISPEGTLSLSITTPEGSGDTVQSSLRTVLSASTIPPPSRDISRDIDNLAEELRNYDRVRGLENEYLGDHLVALRRELEDLGNMMRERREQPSPPRSVVVASSPESPEPRYSRGVQVDGMYSPDFPIPDWGMPDDGGPRLSSPVMPRRPTQIDPRYPVRSTEIKIDMPQPVRPTEIKIDMPQPVRPTVIEIDEPYPPTLTPSSPSLLSRAASYLSSAHSDDWLYELPIPPPLKDDTETTTFTSISSSRSDSRDTYRPLPAIPDEERDDALASALRAIQDQLRALEDGQNATKDVVDALSSKAEVVPERVRVEVVDDELKGRLDRIESLVRDLLERPTTIVHPPPRPPREPEREAELPPFPFTPPRDRDSIITESTDSLYKLTGLLKDLSIAPEDRPPTLLPPTGPTVSEILARQPVIPPVGAIPRLQSFEYTRIEDQLGEEAGRLRSPSPTASLLPPRASTAPPFDFTRAIPTRPADDRQRPRRPDAEPTPPGPLTLTHDSQTQTEPAVPPTEPIFVPVEFPPGPPPRIPRPGPTPRPVIPPLHDPRPTTAPPSVGTVKESWYRPPGAPATGAPLRRGQQPLQPPQPPPPLQQQQPQQPAAVPPVIPVPQPSAIQLPPIFDSLLDILRENRLAQLATVDQQRELMRYMRGLNEWLEKDVHDRQAELRRVVGRVDNLSDIIRRQVPAPQAPLQAVPPPEESEGTSSDDGTIIMLPQQGAPPFGAVPFPGGPPFPTSQYPPNIPFRPPFYPPGPHPVIPVPAPGSRPLTTGVVPLTSGDFFVPTDVPEPIGVIPPRTTTPVEEIFIPPRLSPLPRSPSQGSSTGTGPPRNGIQRSPYGGMGPSGMGRDVYVRDTLSSPSSPYSEPPSPRLARPVRTRHREEDEIRRPSSERRTPPLTIRNATPPFDFDPHRQQFVDTQIPQPQLQIPQPQLPPMMPRTDISYPQPVPSVQIVQPSDHGSYAGRESPFQRHSSYEGRESPFQQQLPLPPQQMLPLQQPMLQQPLQQQPSTIVIQPPPQQPPMVIQQPVPTGPISVTPSMHEPMTPMMPSIGQIPMMPSTQGQMPMMPGMGQMPMMPSTQGQMPMMPGMGQMPMTPIIPGQMPMVPSVGPMPMGPPQILQQYPPPSSRSSSRSRHRHSPRPAPAAAPAAPVIIETHPPPPSQPMLMAQQPQPFMGVPPTMQPPVLISRSRSSSPRSPHRSRTPIQLVSQLPAPTAPTYGPPPSHPMPQQMLMPVQPLPPQPPQMPLVIQEPHSPRSGYPRTHARYSPYREDSPRRPRSPHRHHSPTYRSPSPRTGYPRTHAPTYRHRSPPYREYSPRRPRSPHRHHSPTYRSLSPRTGYPRTHAPTYRHRSPPYREDSSPRSPHRHHSPTYRSPSPRTGYPRTHAPTRHRSPPYREDSPRRPRSPYRSRSPTYHSRSPYQPHRPQHYQTTRYPEGYPRTEEYQPPHSPIHLRRTPPPPSDRHPRVTYGRSEDGESRTPSPVSYRPPSPRRYPRPLDELPPITHREGKEPTIPSKREAEERSLPLIVTIPSPRHPRDEGRGRGRIPFRREPRDYHTYEGYRGPPRGPPRRPRTSEGYRPPRRGRGQRDSISSEPTVRSSSPPVTPRLRRTPHVPAQEGRSERSDSPVSVAPGVPVQKEREEEIAPGIPFGKEREEVAPGVPFGQKREEEVAPGVPVGKEREEVVAPKPQDQPPIFVDAPRVTGVPLLPSDRPLSRGETIPSRPVTPGEDQPIPTFPSGLRYPDVRGSDRPSIVPPRRQETVTPIDYQVADTSRAPLDEINAVTDRLRAAALAAEDAEDRRELDFRGHEDHREELFLQNEDRRNQESRGRADGIWHDLESRLGALPPPRDVTEERPAGQLSPTASIRTIGAIATRAASKHASDILETVEQERKEAQRQFDELANERDKVLQDLKAERDRAVEEKDARIQVLEDELGRLRDELDGERQRQVSEQAEASESMRRELIERDEAFRKQLEDITNTIQGQRDIMEEKKDIMDRRWQEKQERRARKETQAEEREADIIDLRTMLQTIQDSIEAERERCEEERRDAKDGLERVIDDLRRQNAEQRELLTALSENWRADCERHHQETVEAVRSTAHVQVPFNVQGYLDEFSSALATEVRMLLGEVGKIREERRALQHEIGDLLSMKAKYGPGGEYEPDWTPPGAGPPPGPGMPPGMPPPPGPGMPPGPGDMPPMPTAVKPAWRTLHPRPKKKKKSESQPQMQAQPIPSMSGPGPFLGQFPAGFPQQMMEPVDLRSQLNRGSWTTWQPDPANVTPQPIHAQIMTPAPAGPPGLFGARTPSEGSRL